MDQSIKEHLRRAATRPVPEIYPALRALDLLGVRRTDIAKGLGVSLPQVSSWGAGENVPARHRMRLFNLASGGLAAAVEILGETAADRPDLVNTEGFRQYSARVAHAKRLLTELATELQADEESKR